jgi:uncharacterized membrane protein
MHIVKIRYNHDGGETGLNWRVLINGSECYATDLEIHCPAYTTVDFIPGVGEKYHITCEADKIEWDELKIKLIKKGSKVSRIRHILKAITYRVYSSFVTSLIATLITNNYRAGVAIGTADFFIKIFTYYIHERIWYKIPFGLEKINKK